MNIAKLNTHQPVKMRGDFETARKLRLAIEAKRDPKNTDIFSVSDGGRTITVQQSVFKKYEYPDDVHAYVTITNAWGSLDMDPVTMEINFINMENAYLVVFTLKLLNP